MPDAPAGFADNATFILGLPKSGTTLLQSLLDGHPELLVDASESKFLTHWWPVAEDLDPAGRAAFGIEVMLREFGADSINGAYLDHLPRDEVVARFHELASSPEGDGPQSYLLASLLAYGEVSGQISPRLRRWVEKTPVDHEVFGELRSWWPKARAIRVVRDPRANYIAEHRTRDYARPSDFADRWSAQLEGLRAARHDEHQLIVRYEELAEDPTSVMADVAAFLEIEPLESLTQPTKAGGHRAYGGNSSAGASFSGVSTSRTERWRTEASPRVIAIIDSMVGAGLEEFGYEPLTNSMVRRVLGPVLRLARRARPALGRSRRALSGR